MKKMIINRLSEYADNHNNKLYTVSMKRKPDFYKQMLKIIFTMLLAKQTGYRYIQNIVLAIEEQEIRILLK